MLITWQLKQLLAAHGIHNPCELERALMEVLGVRITHQALGKLLNKPPEILKLQTAQYFCNLTQQPLSSFFEIHPEPLIAKPSEIIRPYKRPLRTDDNPFADPLAFL